MDATPFARELDAISFQEWIDGQELPRWIVQMWQTSSLGIASVLTCADLASHEE
mgnify:CR=1 FL=1